MGLYVCPSFVFCDIVTSTPRIQIHFADMYNEKAINSEEQIEVNTCSWWDGFECRGFLAG